MNEKNHRDLYSSLHVNSEITILMLSPRFKMSFEYLKV